MARRRCWQHVAGLARGERYGILRAVSHGKANVVLRLTRTQVRLDAVERALHLVQPTAATQRRLIGHQLSAAIDHTA
jgi:hypothetical protein